MPSLGPVAEQLVRSAPRVEHDEAELVRKAQLGSSAAFEQLVLVRGPDLYRYLVVRLRDDGDARDALQETLTAAWQGLQSLRTPGKFWPWLVGIAAHKAADAMRERVPTGDRTVDAIGRDDGRLLEIVEAIGSLPTHHREVLLLRYLLELSEEEAAEALGIRVGTVKSRSARARKALKELLR
jgi:RNA polymerase sigma factor (sigma-70 family)